QSPDRYWRGRLHRRDRCGLRLLQRRRRQQTADLGRKLECDLVHAVGLCGNQLYRERRLRRLRSARLLAQGLRIGDLAAPRGKSRAAAPRSAIALPFFKSFASAEPLTLPRAVREAEAEARSLLAHNPA